MNSVILVGRLTRDPETRYTQSQMAVTRFSVAVDRQKPKDDQGNQPTADFIDCVAFGKTAELIERFFIKGKPIGLQGRLQNNNYLKDGQQIYTYQVAVDRVEFVGSKDDGQNGGGSSEASHRNDYEPRKTGIPEGFSALEDDDMPF